MVSTNDFHSGLTIEVEGNVYIVMDSEHSRSGRGGAFVRTKLRNIENGKIVNKTFRAEQDVKKAHITKRDMKYLYWDGNNYVFMDNDNYEQIELSRDQLGEKINYLKEDMNLKVAMYEDKPVDIELPTFVNLEVKDTQPSIKGDTVSGGTKPATLETGLEVKVPLFVEEGEVVKIDTRNKKYVERV